MVAWGGFGGQEVLEVAVDRGSRQIIVFAGAAGDRGSPIPEELDSAASHLLNLPGHFDLMAAWPSLESTIAIPFA